MNPIKTIFILFVVIAIAYLTLIVGAFLGLVWVLYFSILVAVSGILYVIGVVFQSIRKGGSRE